MSYDLVAKSDTPGLIIFLIDISGSMGSKTLKGEYSKPYEVLIKAYREVFINLAGPLTYSDGTISNAYHIATCLYNDQLFPAYNNQITTFREVINNNKMPTKNPAGETDTEKAFLWAKDLLSKNIKNYKNSPPPVICHITDGKYTKKSPISVVNEIKKFQVNDGRVLITNIFLSPDVLEKELNSKNIKEWKGISKNDLLKNKYANTLKEMSSDIPEKYLNRIHEFGYNISSGAKLMFPGTSYELIELGLMSSMASRALYVG